MVAFIFTAGRLFGTLTVLRTCIKHASASVNAGIIGMWPIPLVGVAGIDGRGWTFIIANMTGYAKTRHMGGRAVA